MTKTIAVFRRTTADYCKSRVDIAPQEMLTELKSLGVAPLNAQQRLLPGQTLGACRDQFGCTCDQCPVLFKPCTVFEIPEAEFTEHFAQIVAAGYDAWPEDDDVASELYDDDESACACPNDRPELRETDLTTLLDELHDVPQRQGR